MNIQEIKKKVEESVPSLENAPELRYLLSIIERTEKALNRLYLACPPPATSRFEEEYERAEFIESIVGAMEILVAIKHGEE